MTGGWTDLPTGREGNLLAYIRATKKAAAVRAHLGEEDYRYWEGQMTAYQDIESLLATADRSDRSEPDERKRP